MEQYSQTLTRFVAAAIRTLERPEGQFRLPLTESVKVKATELREALRALPPRASQRKKRATSSNGEDTPEEKHAIVKLQQFFFTAVVDSVQESQENRFRCPFLTYTACFAYNADDTFKTAPQVTSMLAQWSFLLRGNALYHAILKSEEGGDQVTALE